MYKLYFFLAFSIVYDCILWVNACAGGKERWCPAKVLTIMMVDDGAKGNYRRKKTDNEFRLR